MPKGFRHSEETKARISNSCRISMKFLDEKAIANRSKRGKKLNYSLSGKNNPMFGRKHSEETKDKIRLKAIGRKISDETKNKLRMAIVGKRRLEKHPLWKGGASFLPYATDWNETLRRSIRERDHYVCQNCGVPQSDKSHAVHHIDYDKMNCDPKNLITLCTQCHSRTNNNDRLNWILVFTGKIRQVYNLQ